MVAIAAHHLFWVQIVWIFFFFNGQTDWNIPDFSSHPKTGKQDAYLNLIFTAARTIWCIARDGDIPQGCNGGMKWNEWKLKDAACEHQRDLQKYHKITANLKVYESAIVNRQNLIFLCDLVCQNHCVWLCVCVCVWIDR